MKIQSIRIVFTLLLTVSIFVLIYQEIIVISINFYRKNKLTINDDEHTQEKLIDAKLTCAFPNIKFDSPIAISFMNRDYEVNKKKYDECEFDDSSGKPIDLLETIGDTLFVKLNTTRLYEVYKFQKFRCFIESYDKKMDQPSIEQSLLTIKKYTFKSQLNYTLNLTTHGFYFLHCFAKQNGSDKVFHQNVYNFLPRNMTILMDERKSFYKPEMEKQYKLNEMLEEPVVLDKSKEFDKKMNVLILGTDSVSYNHFRRILPQTFKYLTEELNNNVVFDKFSSVGSKTYFNVVPMLTGALLSNVEHLDMTSETDQYVKNDGTYHDQFPFLWYDYEKKADYFTILQQDQPYWAFANYLKKGFRYRPTAFYSRPFWLKYYKIRNGPRYCHNFRPTYKTYYDLIEQLLNRMSQNPSLPFFSFNFFVEYTHGTFSIPKQMDTAFYSMLKRLENKGYFDNTLLIIFSDHGNRLNSFPAFTTIGKLERYLPFLSIKLPNNLIGTSLHANLQLNRNKLVGFYDVYQTLRHFLHINMALTTALNTTQYKTNDPKRRQSRGISLFETIPFNRTCSDALIPDAQCPCFQRLPISAGEFKTRTNVTFKEAVILIIDTITNITSDIRNQCTAYKLDKIDNPGNAIFEAFIEQWDNKTKLKINGKINRISAYGDQSKCINDDYLRNYCFCKAKQ